MNATEQTISLLIPNESELTRSRILAYLDQELSNNLTRQRLLTLAEDFQPCNNKYMIDNFRNYYNSQNITLIRDYEHEFNQLTERIFSQMTEQEFLSIKRYITYDGLAEKIVTHKASLPSSFFSDILTNSFAQLLTLEELEPGIHYLNFCNIPYIKPDTSHIEKIMEDNDDHYVVITHDTWGNHTDGYNVNANVKSVEVHRNDFVDYIIDEFGVEIEFDCSNDPIIEINEIYTGKPLGSIEISAPF